MTSIDLGDFPGWVQAGTTAVALYFAYRAARTAERLYLVERERDEERSKAVEQEQAARVVIWMEQDTEAKTDHDVDLGFMTGERGTAQRWEPLAVVRNASDLPITDVIIWFQRETVHGPDDSEFRDDAQNHPGIPPGSTYKFRADPSLLKPRSYGNADIAFKVSVYFKDAARREWIRHADGRLERTSRNPGRSHS
ncbi:hypothetical protein O7600_12465 [Micromonospora sp. WMMA1998]|uniref:hypothetical protein n=1 Tax=Micromonospora sp. WMMA1998 TaxID=3015167 RepID=UPI00248C342C|nr:hypothetical protein [Micromonospora sp. WMMA1998]WBC17579.1 hypothetical protein O7600_12465 [Micromonospora sp. WMMA1998]